MWLDKCDYIFRLMAYRPWYRVYSCLQRRKVTPLPKIPNFFKQPLSSDKCSLVLHKS